MNRETVLALNEINRRFYRRTAKEFSATRQTPWPGFARVVRALRGASGADALPSLLDVGCGNGRFATTLLREFGAPFRYLGIDASPELLAEASRRHERQEALNFRRLDFVADSVDAELGGEKFTGIVLFGVLHHVPGAATRKRLLGELAERLHPGGVLALSLWRFGELERFRRRFVPWERLEEHASLRVDRSQLEPGDHLLPFGAEGQRFRYCHALEAGEMRELLDALPLLPLESFDADGQSGDLNQYILRVRPRA